MYRINRLTRPTLIVVDEVLAKAVIDENADIRYILNSIEVAEERYIAPALGDSFYEDFISQKNIVITSSNQAAMLLNINSSLAAAGKNPIQTSDLPYGIMVNAIELCATNYQQLWNRFLWRIVAEAVDICAIVPSWTRTTAQGQQQNNPKTLSSDGTGSATADRKDIEFKIDTMMQQRLYPLIARMKKWIEENGTFTLFPATQKDVGTNSQGKGGIIFGLYRDVSLNGPNMWQVGQNYDDRCGKENTCGPSPAPSPTPAPPLTTWRSVKLYIVTTPDPLQLIAMGGGHIIQAEYAPGGAFTPMNTGDASGYFAGRRYLLPIMLNNMVYPDDQYNSTDGIFTGGFNDGDIITITIEDNV